MNKPEVWSLGRLAASDLERAAIWTIPPLLQKIQTRFSLPVILENEEPDRELGKLIVIGGGVLIDRAKIWRKENNPGMELIAIPSLWGSGAENSPIAVLNEEGKKIIKMGHEFLPDKRCIWVELSEDLPQNLMKWACGDVWAHALEGFLSPVAHDDVRAELAEVIRTLEGLPMLNDPNWFDLSARACAGQAKSSLGLVHGIAHTIEGLLRTKYTEEYVGHARLCATYLWPVMSLNSLHCDKVNKMFGNYGINRAQVEKAAKQLFDRQLYDLSIPVLEDNWRSILRDPSSRTNCVLVKSDYVSHFINFESI